MRLDLANYETQAREAVKLFWGNREAALAKQIQSGNKDVGSRGAVTAGKNMNGFLTIAKSLIEANGLALADIFIQQRVLTLPGFFRATKLWDMLVMHHGEFVAALEFKSQVGPSFGNNFNNRSEEAIGTAHDLWTAYREGAFGKDAPRRFLVGLCSLRIATSPTRRCRTKSHTSLLTQLSKTHPTRNATTYCANGLYRKGSIQAQLSWLRPARRLKTASIATSVSSPRSRHS